MPAGDTVLIRGARVLTVDPNLGIVDADLLVIGGTIRAVGVELDVDQDVPVLDAAGMVAMPGMVDTHRHTWQAALRFSAVGWDLADYMQDLQQLTAPYFTPDDVYAGNLLGALTALDAGITTLRDESHVQNSREHGEAAVQALRDSGIRASFGHGWPSSLEYMADSDLPHPESLEWIRENVLPGDDALVTMHAHLRGPALSTPAQAIDDLRRARTLGLRCSIHAGAAIQPGMREVAVLDAEGLLDDDITFVHCCTTSLEDLRRLAATGCSASVCATVEAVMPGLGRPATGRLLAAGVRPTLGVDVEVAAAGDLLGVARSALACHQLLGAIDKEFVGGDVRLEPQDLLAFATVDGANACGLGNRTGTLAPGKSADIVLLRMDDTNLTPAADTAKAILAAAHPGNVDTVLVAGEVRKRHGRLDDDLLRRAQRLAGESAQRMIGLLADRGANAADD